MFLVPLAHLGNILRWKKSFLAWESLLAYAFLFSKDSADDTGRGLFGNLQHNHKSNPCPEPQEKLNKLVEAADKADNNKLKDSIQSRNPRLFLGVGECMHVWVCCCTCVCVCVCVLLCLWVFGLLLCAAAAPPIATHWLQHHPLVHPSVPHRRHFVYDAIRGWGGRGSRRTKGNSPGSLCLALNTFTRPSGNSCSSLAFLLSVALICIHRGLRTRIL